MASAEAKKCWARFVSEYSDVFCRLGEVLLAFSSGVLTFATFGTAYWIEEEVSDTSTPGARRHSGLWQNCSSLDTTCHSIPLSGPSYLQAARFFMCIALVGGVAAWILSIVGLLQHRARWLLIAAICYAIQAILMLIGLASFSSVFHCQTIDKCPQKPSWSYDIGWVAMVISFLCSLYFVSVGIYRFRHPNDPVTHPGVSKVYAPLAQFASTESGSDDDDDENL